MSFIAGAIIGTVGAVAGGMIASKGAKDSAKIAAQGAEQDIAFQRESRDLARADQKPYREAGYTALDALMSMTGLKRPVVPNSPVMRGAIMGDGSGGIPRNYRTDPTRDSMRRSGYGAPVPGWSVMGRSYYNTPTTYNALQVPDWWRDDRELRSNYAGGPTEGGVMYNVHELGPENVYADGKVTRGRGPATIDGKTGYVEPNIEGRALGGMIHDRSPGPATRPGDPDWNYTAPKENPGGVEGGYNFMTDPGYEFRMGEGMRALERSAAARGGLLSGGFARKAIRYGQDYASNEYTNVYNRIANIAGLGQVANNQSSNAALYTGAGMGAAASNRGYALAAGNQASTNAWSNSINQISQLPWGEVFNRPSAPNQNELGGGQGGIPFRGWSP